MIFFLISYFSVILISKSFLKLLPNWKSEMSVLSVAWFLGEVSNILFLWVRKSSIGIPSMEMAIVVSSRAENVETTSLLDLPDMALESILERLSPSGLCRMAVVCKYLRDRCESDHLWVRHMKPKWCRLIGDAAYEQWKLDVASRRRSIFLDGKGKKRRVLGYLQSWWPNVGLNSDECSGMKSCFCDDSIMGLYIALETGKFWFPAQVYNRENGHIGFMLSCYDAEVSYDSHTDTFRARYLGHERQSVEENIGWDRLRVPAVNTPPHTLHASNCLNDLKPGDHIEIQWRRDKEFPNGWWYGVVGHLESCDGNEYQCRCQSSDTVILEFKHYPTNSRWRQTVINRKEHREVGNEADGFYGGIRKLYKEEETYVWKRLWPKKSLE